MIIILSCHLSYLFACVKKKDFVLYKTILW